MPRRRWAICLLLAAQSHDEGGCGCQLAAAEVLHGTTELLADQWVPAGMLGICHGEGEAELKVEVDSSRMSSEEALAASAASIELSMGVASDFQWPFHDHRLIGAQPCLHRGHAVNYSLTRAMEQSGSLFQADARLRIPSDGYEHTSFNRSSDVDLDRSCHVLFITFGVCGDQHFNLQHFAVKWSVRLTNAGQQVSWDVRLAAILATALLLVCAAAAAVFTLSESHNDLQSLLAVAAALQTLAAGANLFHLRSMHSIGIPRVKALKMAKRLDVGAGLTLAGSAIALVVQSANSTAEGHAPVSSCEEEAEAKESKAVDQQTASSRSAFIPAIAYFVMQCVLSWHAEPHAFEDVMYVYLERLRTSGHAWDARTVLAAAVWLGLAVRSAGLLSSSAVRRPLGEALLRAAPACALLGPSFLRAVCAVPRAVWRPVVYSVGKVIVTGLCYYFMFLELWRGSAAGRSAAPGVRTTTTEAVAKVIETFAPQPVEPPKPESAAAVETKPVSRWSRLNLMVMPSVVLVAVMVGLTIVRSQLSRLQDGAADLDEVVSEMSQSCRLDSAGRSSHPSGKGAAAVQRGASGAHAGGIDDHENNFSLFMGMPDVAAYPFSGILAPCFVRTWFPRPKQLEQCAVVGGSPYIDSVGEAIDAHSVVFRSAGSCTAATKTSRFRQVGRRTDYCISSSLIDRPKENITLAVVIKSWRQLLEMPRRLTNPPQTCNQSLLLLHPERLHSWDEQVTGWAEEYRFGSEAASVDSARKKSHRCDLRCSTLLDVKGAQACPEGCPKVLDFSLSFVAVALAMELCKQVTVFGFDFGLEPNGPATMVVEEPAAPPLEEPPPEEHHEDGTDGSGEAENKEEEADDEHLGPRHPDDEEPPHGGARRLAGPPKRAGKAPPGPKPEKPLPDEVAKPSELEARLVALWHRLGMLNVSKTYQGDIVSRLGLDAPARRRNSRSVKSSSESQERRFAWRHGNSSSVWKPPVEPLGFLGTLLLGIR